MGLPTYYHKEFELYSGTNEMPHLRETHLVNSDGLQGASEEAKAAVKERKEGRKEAALFLMASIKGNKMPVSFHRKGSALHGLHDPHPAQRNSPCGGKPSPEPEAHTWFLGSLRLNMMLRYLLL